MARPKPKTLLSVFGAVFSILEFICMVVAFSSPNWVEYNNYRGRDRVFRKMGLWEACFDHWTYYKDYLGKTYNGCWWMFSFEYRYIWTWLNPPWFLAIQIMLTLCVIMQMITIVFVMLYVLKCCPALKERSYVRACHGMNFVCFGFISISSIIFAVKTDTDRQWLPHPDSNLLSWSFAFNVVAGFFALFAALCLLMEDIRIGEEEKRDRKPAYAIKSNPRF